MLKWYFEKSHHPKTRENHARSVAHETSLDDCSSWNFCLVCSRNFWRTFIQRHDFDAGHVLLGCRSVFGEVLDYGFRLLLTPNSHLSSDSRRHVRCTSTAPLVVEPLLQRQKLSWKCHSWEFPRRLPFLEFLEIANEKFFQRTSLWALKFDVERLLSGCRSVFEEVLEHGFSTVEDTKLTSEFGRWTTCSPYFDSTSAMKTTCVGHQTHIWVRSLNDVFTILRQLFAKSHPPKTREN